KGNHGNGVSTNLIGIDNVINAIEVAKRYGNYFLIEEMAKGNDYRLLVINYKLIAVAHRSPPQVIGNGVSTIKKLIEVLNVDPQRKEGHSGFLTKVEIDDVCIKFLKQQGLTPESIPSLGQAINLRANANLSTGGTAVDVTNQVH